MKPYVFFAATIIVFSSSISSNISAQTAAAPFVYETPREFFSRGDFNGDNLSDIVIVDKETGKYRLGYLAETGLNWVDNRPSGIKGISGFAVGPAAVTNLDALVFTSADANELTVVEAPTAATANRPVNISFLAALGPNLVVPVEIAGEGNTPAADFYVGSIYNSPDANLVTLVRNDGATYDKIAEAPIPGPAARGNRIAIQPARELVAVLVKAEAGDLLRLDDASTGKLVNAATLSGLPSGSDYAAGRFGGASTPQFILYKPGENNISVRNLQKPGPDKVEFGPANSFDLGAPVRRVLCLSQGSEEHLFVIFGEGEKAALYKFDGQSAPASIQRFAATNDLFTAAAGLPSGLVLFSQPAGGKFSSRYQLYNRSGSGYVAGAFGSLPSLADNDNIIIPEIHDRIATKNNVDSESGMKPYTNAIPGTRVTYAMVPIPGGEFLMGSPETETKRKPDEGPQHKVKISPFWMGKFEVTWNEYELFMYPDEERRTRATVPTDEDGDKLADAVTHPSKPYVEMSFGMGKDGFPAISMTQHAANKYCQWLSAKTGHFYRLPTEAEWEYACRAGTTTAYYFGDEVSQLKDYGWYEQNSDFKYQKVGKKKPNPWGLHDMCGNVVEWVLDQYDADYYSRCSGAAVTQDPWNKASKPYPHSVRGGSWDDEESMLRSAARRGSDRTWKMQDPQLPKSIWYFSDAQFVGFRIVRPLKVPPPEDMQKYWSSGVERD